MVFFGVKIFVVSAAQRKLFSRHYFFLQKQFLRHKVLSEYFVLPISETEIYFPSNLLIEPPSTPTPLQVKWMFPYTYNVPGLIFNFSIPA